MLIKILNLTKFRCPDTIIMLRKKTKNIKSQETVLIITNDNSTKWEIPLFCNFKNYSLIKKKNQKKPYIFLIKKK